MNLLQFKNITSVINDYDAFLFDLWGVIIEGTKIYPGVIDTINKIASERKVFFVSNAPQARTFTFERLKSWGLNTTIEMIYTSGEIARQMVLARQKTLNIDTPVIYHLGGDRNRDIIIDLNFETTEHIEKANILLLTLYRDEGDNLEEFDNLLKIAADKNIITICANPDTIIPNLGFKRYCSGYFAEKLEQFGGKVIYTGKPYSIIYDQVLSTLPEISKNRILMIGDTFDTDILGANKAGIHSCLVISGNAEKFHLGFEELEDKLFQLQIAAAKAGVVPNFITKLT